MKEILDFLMLAGFVGLLGFLLRGVALQTAKKDELRKKFKKEKDERVVD